MSRFIQELRRLKNDTRGASLIYVTVSMALLFAFTGMAVDISRLTTTHTQARAAAEAAALAAARQLDGSPDSITRANAAAATFVARDQRFGEQESAGNIAITMRYLTDLPADDEAPIAGSMYTTDPTEALYAEATTEVINHSNFFLPTIGIADSTDITGVAVAGQTSAICRVTPLAICNPGEELNGSGASFNFDEWLGRQILVRKGGANSSWAPGNFGLLDSTNGQGTPNLADQLAGIDGANVCFSSRLGAEHQI